MSILKYMILAGKIQESDDKDDIIRDKDREIYDDKNEIRKLKKELEETKRKLANANINQIPQWKITEMYKQQTRNEELEREKEYYSSLLSKPMLEIAEKNRDFKRTYEKQQAILAKFIIENQAMKELAQSYGLELGKSDEDFDQELDEAKEAVESGNSQFDNNVAPERLKEVARLSEIEKEENEKQRLIDEQIENGRKNIDEWIESLSKDKLKKSTENEQNIEIEMENNLINKSLNR